MYVSGVVNCWSVVYTHQSICAVKGSSVDLGCSYSYPSNVIVTETFWHKPEIMEDLSKKGEYKNRVKYLGNKDSDCALKIEDLQESDSGEYRFRFLTNDTSGMFSGVPGITLSVSNLQVEMTPTTVTEGQSVTLTCSTSCPGDTNPTYIWYQTRQPVTNQHTISYDTLTLSSVSKTDAGRYSCALRGHEDHPSPSVCVLDCWSVVYTHQSICAVKGSSVDLGCSFSYPNNVTVTETFWHKPKIMEDLSKKGEYAKRVKYLGNKDSDCALRIEDLRESDSGEYQFRFLTNDTSGKFSGIPGITLSVSILQVEMSPTTVTEGQSVTLTCRPTCDTGAKPTFAWYKNSKPVANQPPTTMTINTVKNTDSGSYSCAVQGHENNTSPAVALIVQYSPKNTSASISPSGNIVEGDSVTLTCSSDANPPVHNYTWYNINRGETTLESGQNHSISNISSQDIGQYYCRATNLVGSSNSTLLSIDVFYSPKNTSASISPSGNIVEGDSVTLTCSSDANPPVHNYTWYKVNSRETTLGSGQNHPINNISSEDTGQYYCRVENSVGSIDSVVLYVNVFYRPKNTLLVVSPLNETPTGHSVTLTCNSDANPPVHTYTWYKKTGDDSVHEVSANNRTLTLVSGDGGLYYCVAHNQYGSHNSSAIEVTFSDALEDALASKTLLNVWTLMNVYISTCALCYTLRLCQIVTLPLCEQGDSGPVCDDIAAVPMTSDPKQRVDSGDEDDVQYASVQFKARNKDKAPDCTATQPHVQEKEEDVTYASVNICRPSSGGNQ
ncbi:hypothetical protein ACEWY4_017777 [Coilia grayii]|uniref:B-cell receptor CD22 n=1 Tax=Coilia grayii TaxID=363190 RepID=A0ABD1JL87_9TELE